VTSLRLDGRTAIVTGVGPGIGSAVGEAFADAGAHVVLCARNEDRIAQLAEQLRSRGAKAIAVRADVGKEADLEALVASAEREFGAVDIVFNNAHANPAWRAQPETKHGFARTQMPDKGALEFTTEDWTVCFDVNVLAPYRLAQAVVPGMKERGYGVIITVLSGTAFRPALPVVPYATTKAALHMMTRYLAKACGPEVRVNAVCPASISDDGSVWEAFRRQLPNIPLQRVGLPAEVAGAALYLASDASSYSTGQVLFVDGGRINTT
jgi:NAD(P)-dependent dehydrogenase (short-subunit alcohol dehydrogenase family)